MLYHRTHLNEGNIGMKAEQSDVKCSSDKLTLSAIEPSGIPKIFMLHILYRSVIQTASFPKLQSPSNIFMREFSFLFAFFTPTSSIQYFPIPYLVKTISSKD